MSSEPAEKRVPDSRLYRCRNCGELAAVCRSCDRGQIYCGPDCSAAARRARVRDSRRRYRKSERGRAASRRRQAKHRAQASGSGKDVATKDMVTRETTRDREPGSLDRAAGTGTCGRVPAPPRRLPKRGAVRESGASRRDVRKATDLATCCSLCHRRTSGYLRNQFLPPAGPRPARGWLDHGPAAPSRTSSLRSARGAPGPSLGPRCEARTGRGDAACPPGAGQAGSSQEISCDQLPPGRLGL